MAEISSFFCEGRDELAWEGLVWSRDTVKPVVDARDLRFVCSSCLLLERGLADAGTQGPRIRAALVHWLRVAPDIIWTPRAVGSPKLPPHPLLTTILVALPQPNPLAALTGSLSLGKGLSCPFLPPGLRPWLPAYSRLPVASCSRATRQASTISPPESSLVIPNRSNCKPRTPQGSLLLCGL